MVKGSEIKAIRFEDKDYPKLLKDIPNPPKVLYVRGNVALLQKRGIAVVGTRRPSLYGIQIAQRLVPGLVKKFVIVSGLAYGIDSLAHQITLERGGNTIAVLGTGLDDASIYPREHVGLARRIIEQGGVLISEYPSGVGPQKYHFPMRNRIIAGMCEQVLVVEATPRGGSALTAKLGRQYGRKVLMAAN